MSRTPPSMEQWLREAKCDESAPDIGMYLTHNGVVRKTARASVRHGIQNTASVRGMEFSYDRKKVDEVISDTLGMEGIFYVRVWLNKGVLSVGEDIMYVLVGGDIRPRVMNALDYLVGQLKETCVTERELFQEEMV